MCSALKSLLKWLHGLFLLAARSSGVFAGTTDVLLVLPSTDSFSSAMPALTYVCPVVQISQRLHKQRSFKDDYVLSARDPLMRGQSKLLLLLLDFVRTARGRKMIASILEVFCLVNGRTAAQALLGYKIWVSHG